MFSGSYMASVAKRTDSFATNLHKSTSLVPSGQIKCSMRHVAMLALSFDAHSKQTWADQRSVCPALGTLDPYLIAGEIQCIYLLDMYLHARLAYVFHTLRNVRLAYTTL